MEKSQSCRLPSEGAAPLPERFHITFGPLMILAALKSGSVSVSETCTMLSRLLGIALSDSLKRRVERWISDLRKEGVLQITNAPSATEPQSKLCALTALGLQKVEVLCRALGGELTLASEIDYRKALSDEVFGAACLGIVARHGMATVSLIDSTIKAELRVSIEEQTLRYEIVNLRRISLLAFSPNGPSRKPAWYTLTTGGKSVVLALRNAFGLEVQDIEDAQPLPDHEIVRRRRAKAPDKRRKPPRAPKPKPKPDPQPKPQPEFHPEPRPETQPEPYPGPAAEPKPEPEPMSPEPMVAPEPEPEGIDATAVRVNSLPEPSIGAEELHHDGPVPEAQACSLLNRLVATLLILAEAERPITIAAVVQKTRAKGYDLNASLVNSIIAEEAALFTPRRTASSFFTLYEAARFALGIVAAALDPQVRRPAPCDQLLEGRRKILRSASMQRIVVLAILGMEQSANDNDQGVSPAKMAFGLEWLLAESTLDFIGPQVQALLDERLIEAVPLGFRLSPSGAEVLAQCRVLCPIKPQSILDYQSVKRAWAKHQFLALEGHSKRRAEHGDVTAWVCETLTIIGPCHLSELYEHLAKEGDVVATPSMEVLADVVDALIQEGRVVSHQSTSKAGDLLELAE